MPPTAGQSALMRDASGVAARDDWMIAELRLILTVLSLASIRDEAAKGGYWRPLTASGSTDLRPLAAPVDPLPGRPGRAPRGRTWNISPPRPGAEEGRS